MAENDQVNSCDPPAASATGPAGNGPERGITVPTPVLPSVALSAEMLADPLLLTVNRTSNVRPSATMPMTEEEETRLPGETTSISVDESGPVERNAPELMSFPVTVAVNFSVPGGLAAR